MKTRKELIEDIAKTAGSAERILTEYECIPEIDTKHETRAWAMMHSIQDGDMEYVIDEIKRLAILLGAAKNEEKTLREYFNSSLETNVIQIF